MFVAIARRILAPLLISLLVLVSACSQVAPPPSPYEQVQEETTGRKVPGAVADDAVQGSQFNRLFPGSVEGYEVIPAQEKQGFAEYKLNYDGETVAMLSINDTISNPEAAAKFTDSDRQIAGYPAFFLGQQTAILVADRFQVKVQSRSETFGAGDREDWLTRFDLEELAQL